MKFNLNGATVEIKVTPAGAKKTDPVKTDLMYHDIQLALIHASNFCRGNGLVTAANRYIDIAFAMDNNK